MPSWESNNQIRLGEAVLTVDDSSIIQKDRDDLQHKKRYNLNISSFVNSKLPTVRYGTGIPTFIVTDTKGTEYLRTPSGNNTTIATESWVFDGTSWGLRPAGSVSFVEYTGNNTIPVGVPNLGVDTRVLLNGSRYDWNGIAWILQTAAVLNDFWRSDAGTSLPNGTTDVTENITRIGNVGIGTIPTTMPLAKFEVAKNNRSGIDPRVTSTVSYVTGNLQTISTGVTPTTDQIEFRHDNQTQGIGVAFDGLYATGNTPNQSFNVLNKGSGSHRKIWQSGTISIDEFWNQAAILTGSGIKNVYRIGANGTDVNVSNYYPVFVESTAPLNVRQQFDIVSNGTLTTALKIQPDKAEVNNTSLYVGENRANNRKIVLWDNTPNSLVSFFGFGINNNTLRYQVNATTSMHSFFNGAVETLRAGNAFNTFRVPVTSGTTGQALRSVNTVGDATWQPTLQRLRFPTTTFTNVANAIATPIVAQNEIIECYLAVFGNPNVGGIRSATYTFRIENSQLVSGRATASCTFTQLSATSLRLNQPGNYNSRIDLIGGVLSFTYIGNSGVGNNFSGSYMRYV